MNEQHAIVKEKILKNKLIVIIRGVDEDKIIPVVKAIIDGGAKLAEITFDHTDKISSERTVRQIASVKNAFGDSIEVGAGTVLDCGDVYAAKSAGATFIISPNTDELVIKGSKKLGLVSIPGAYTPTEICNAYKWGADFVKLFPLSDSPAEYIKAVRAPLKHISMLAVGGVSPENTAEVFSAGVCGVGIGSGIVKASEVNLYKNENDFMAVTEKVRKYLSVINSL